MSRPTLHSDIMLALSAIAAELNVAVDELPSGITGVLRGLSAAHYAAGVHDTNERYARKREPPPAWSTESTPVVGPRGRRMSELPGVIRYSTRPTPIIPPPSDEEEN